MDINTENLANHELNCSLKQDEVVVIMVPVPAQGHLNQLLQFTCLISSYSLRVYYVGLAAYNHKARVRANALNPSDIAKIHFHDLPSTPDFASSKSPTLFNACMLLREPIASFLRDISSKARRVVIVHDALMSYNVQDVSSFPNVESYIYHCISSFDMYCSYICEIARRLELPEGFEERVKGVGLVVREWATHPEILAHLSTGGFMSHCGWNSCIESITMGVPIAVWPMHSDQPINGFLVTEILKIGLIVREWEKCEELVSAYTIENVVRKLMASEEGDELRKKKAEELGEAVRQSTEKGGASRIQLDSFIVHITR